jgi:hypothetical protein
MATTVPTREMNVIQCYSPPELYRGPIMNWKLIQLFNKALSCPCDLATFKSVNENAMKAGYLIHPDCCGSSEIQKFLKNEIYNPNSTFYKTFEEVEAKGALELVFDQLMHYASTYGTGHTQEGNGYVPNDEPPVIEFSKYKVILPATEEEIFEECYGMLKSGIAINEKTLNLLMEYIKDYHFLPKVDVDEIANKEAQAIFSVNMGKYPNQAISVLRVLMYLLTEDTAMLVKSKQSITRLKMIVDGMSSDKRKNLNKILKERDVVLSTVFYRYKPIILAMKCSETSTVINRIRKLAVKNHKPMKVGFWERCFNPMDKTDAYIKEAKEKVDSLTAFKKAQLMQGILERINGQDTDGRMFVVRNGKVYVREGYKSPCDEDYLFELYDVIKDSYVRNLSLKAITKVETKDAEDNVVVLERPTRIKLPKGLELTLPTSEKNFVGNFPMGSSVVLAETDNVIGIYWRNDWGARDYDLHLITKTGKHYGWNGDYHGEEFGKIVYSGDMTSADPEAAECLYIEKGAPNSVIAVNKFSGSHNAKFKLFVAVDPDKNSLQRTRELKDAMVDPNKIVFEAEIEHDSDGTKNVAKIENGRMIMSNFETGGHSRVPSVSMSKIIEEQSKVKANSYISLEELLIKAGFELVDEEADIDLTQMSKNDLIKLVC